MARAACPGETWPEEPLVGAGPPPSNGAGPLRHRHAAARGFCTRAIHICFSPPPPLDCPPDRFTRARVSPLLGRPPPPSSPPPLFATHVARSSPHCFRPPAPTERQRVATAAVLRASAYARRRTPQFPPCFRFEFVVFRIFPLLPNGITLWKPSRRRFRTSDFSPRPANVYSQRVYDGTDRANRQ